MHEIDESVDAPFDVGFDVPDNFMQREMLSLDRGDNDNDSDEKEVGKQSHATTHRHIGKRRRQPLSQTDRMILHYRSDDSLDHPLPIPEEHAKRRKCCYGCRNIARLVLEREALRRAEWSPGVLARALVYNLGYVVGENIYESPSGMRIAAFLVVVALINEFFCQCVRFVFRNRLRASVEENIDETLNWACGNGSTPVPMRRTAEDAIYERAERMFVLVRFFAITAIASSMNETLRRAFSGRGDAATTMLMFVVIFIVSDALESVTSLR